VTTRPKREGEVNKVDYEFIPEAAFDALVLMEELAEWAVVHEHRYGTRKKAITRATVAGKNIVMDVDVQGGMSIKRLFPESVLIFILPPSREELEHRLRGRASDDEEVIRTRLANSLDELTWAEKYDYLVINDVLDDAVRDTKTIITAERLRTWRRVEA